MSSRNFKVVPCRFFGSSQGCRRGAACTFLHTLSDDANHSHDIQRRDNHHRLGPDEFQLWSYDVPRDATAALLGSRLPRFFDQAYKLMLTDASTLQAVIGRLSGEGGLCRINEIIQNINESSEDAISTQVKLFKDQLLRLFQILSHSHVVSSLILESPLERIANFLFGVAGRRALCIFEFSGRMLSHLADTGSDELAVALEASSAVLSTVVDLNGTAVVMDGLNPIVEIMVDCLDSVISSNDGLSVLNSRNSVQRIQRRLGIGAALPELKPQQKAISDLPTFRLYRDAPGRLSEQGPRHDNDSENIHDIKIMPTASELQSQRMEYLPVIDSTQLHKPGSKGLLDRQFRLLREDTVGQLRNAVRLQLDWNTGVSTSSETNRRESARTNVYQHALFRDFSLHKFRGLDLIYEFEQPSPARRLDSKQRRAWWQSSKRLQIGALVCLLDVNNTPIFCVVSETGLITDDGPSFSAKNVPTAADKGLNVFEHPETAFITLSLVETAQAGVNLILNGFLTTRGRGYEMLIEFPGVLLPSFQPTLQALQRMSKSTTDIPFARLLAPSNSDQTALQDIGPPAYCSQGNFRFDLSCLVADNSPVWLTPGEAYDSRSLLQQSTLDEAQASSLLAALTRKLAIIQGPPGTGKSYTGTAIIKVLLANRDKARLGPIICVCYTNHALDQLLEHLLEDGVDKIIRIGSRSKSEVLQKLNLTHVAREMEQTRTEKSLWWSSKTEMDKHLTHANSLLRAFSQAATPKSIREYLLKHNSTHFQQLFGGDAVVDEEGFQEVRHKSSTPLQDWLSMRSGSRLPPRHEQRPLEELDRSHLLSMSKVERRTLFANWVVQIRSKARISFDRVLREYLATRSLMESVRQETDLRCLRQAHVIGVTTTGLARIMGVLERVYAKVLVCEEAGEVLEAHTLATLLPSIEHAILIGDHQQLRPQIQNYELQRENPRGKQFSLDVSLFERLVEPLSATSGRIPFSVLDVQRRMHPSISKLIRSTCYPNLCDAENVHNYPEVSGMRGRLFWLDHDHAEAGKDGDEVMSTSHSNDFEVKMTTALVNHLIRQGTYTSEDIAVLTPYLGQLRKLRQELSSSLAVVVGDSDITELQRGGFEADVEEPKASKTTLLKAVRLATIDNFQGEEAKVIVISLVRCNDENKCGFLRTPNRINVLLSRAKHGMYIIGNAKTSSHVPMWADVISMLQEDGNFGNALELSCPRHPETAIQVKTPDDFVVLSPEGGCSLKCSQRLSCGHACINKCHSDILHQTVRCLEPCSRFAEHCSTHTCPNVCGDPCPLRCNAEVHGMSLPCGHVETLPCHESKHPELARCMRRIEWPMDGCGHTIDIPCHKRNDLGVVTCTADCNAILACGHICKQSCSSCRTTDETGAVLVSHKKCKQVCGRPYSTCNHSCQASCHGDAPCPLCDSLCEVSCSHSACGKTCSEPCTPCAEEKCSSRCPHQQCEMPCGVPCNWLPCSMRCQNLLDCGHQCPSACGEPCPSIKFCQTCCSGDIKSNTVDFITMDAYEDVDLDSDPCMFSPCGHFFTRSSMDGVLEMAEHYELDGAGVVTSVKSVSDPFSSTKMKSCPACRGSLRGMSRYGRIVRRAMLDESTKRFISWAHSEYQKLESRMSVEEDLLSNTEAQHLIEGSLELQGSRGHQIHTIQRLPLFPRANKSAIKFRADVLNFAKRVRGEEQPFQRVRQMIESVRLRKGAHADDLSNSVGAVQVRHSLLATSLLLRIDLLLLSAVVNLKRAGRAKNPLVEDTADRDFVVDLSANRKDCLDLAALAEQDKQPAQQVDGLVLFARFSALQCSVAPFSEGGVSLNQENGQDPTASSDRICSIAKLRETALDYLQEARVICKKHPGSTRGMLAELESTETMLNESWFENVTNEERREVIAAMATEFSGTGHWYYCVNGHPFTIGECGRPMEQTICPSCDAPIGGQSHQPAVGVTRAEDLESMLGNLHL